MGNVFEKAQQQRAAKAPAAAPAPAAATGAFKPRAPAPVSDGMNGAPAPAKQTVAGGAPWARPDCPACEGFGFNSKGRACPICDKTANQLGRPKSEMYEIAVDATSIVAVARAEHAEAIEAMGAALEWEGVPPGATPAAPAAPAPSAPAKGAFAKAAAPAPAASAAPSGAFARHAAPAAEEAPAEAPTLGRGRGRPKGSLNKKTLAAQGAEAEQVEEVETEEPPPVTRSAFNRTAPAAAPAAATPTRAFAPRAAQVTAQAEEAKAEAISGWTPPPLVPTGRPKVGVTLCRAANILQGPIKPIKMAQTLLEELGSEMAKDMGAKSYWELDPWKRRDRLKAAGEAIAESLGRTIVVFVGCDNDPDLMALFNGLVPFAELVI